MEIGRQIKNHRADMGLSQEELAERVYVTRQTVSNWETEKSYPDIHSLLAMSQLFEISLDELVKGDLEMMEKVTKSDDRKGFNRLNVAFFVSLVVVILAIVPLTYFLGLYGMAIWALLWLISMVLAFRVEKWKKANDVQTYREIVAFMDGKQLDEIAKEEERRKRPLQKFSIVIIFTIISVAIAFLIQFLLKLIFKQ
ncbi:helix-turn-helix domain-containing protein [Lactovum odontotermitis]